jgi:hypothetical protein
MTSRVAELAAGVSADLQRRLPGQRKTQHDKLALLVATMLDAQRQFDGLGSVIAAPGGTRGHALSVDRTVHRQRPRGL